MPVMATTADNAATALRLARAGFAVFPCQPGGAKAKQPMPFIKWREASTCSEAQIRQWWQKWPDAAIGLDLAKSGLIVIDADRHDHDGVTALGDLMASHGYVPDGVPLVATPNEGTHFFYRQPAGKQFGNGRGTLPPGVDVRGHGGYVIAPGTVMQDGRLYEVFSDIADAPELPAWLVASSNRSARLRPPNGLPCRQGRAPARSRSCCHTFRPTAAITTGWPSLWRCMPPAPSVDLADQWSATGGAKYPGSKEIEKKWRSFKRAGISSRTLAMIAERHGADLAAIAIRHNSPPDDGYDTRKLLVGADGTLADAETGEIVEAAPIAGVPSVYTDYPPGLVGMIAQWIVDTARRPQPELSIGAALAIVGTVAGRQFCGPTRSGTHLYVLGLAPTGTGKDHPLQAIGRIMSAAKLTAHLGPSEFISMPAVVNFLTRRPLSICAMDEFGGFMKRINSKRASGFEGAISKVIRTMWSTSFAPYATPEWAQKESQMIFAPAMSMYGASTPEQFYSAMEGASIEDGTLNRFLLLNGQNGPAEVDPEYDASRVPVEIVRDIGFIYGRSGDMSKTYRNDAGTDPAAHGAVIQLPWCADGAHKRYKALTAEVERIMRKEPESAAFYARAAEMALRIATIVAIGRLEDEQVRLADLEFGIGLAMTSSRIMAEGAADYMSENENQSNAQKVMRIIKSRAGDALIATCCGRCKARSRRAT
jgi:hypothetical protein